MLTALNPKLTIRVYEI